MWRACPSQLSRFAAQVYKCNFNAICFSFWLPSPMIQREWLILSPQANTGFGSAVSHIHNLSQLWFIVAHIHTLQLQPSAAGQWAAVMALLGLLHHLHHQGLTSITVETVPQPEFPWWSSSLLANRWWIHRFLKNYLSLMVHQNSLTQGNLINGLRL